MRKNGIKDFKWIFYRQNLGKLLKIGFLALVGLFFQKKWGTNKIKSVSTYPWNVKWILLFSNFDFHILSPPPTRIIISGRSRVPGGGVVVVGWCEVIIVSNPTRLRLGYGWVVVRLGFWQFTWLKLVHQFNNIRKDENFTRRFIRRY